MILYKDERRRLIEEIERWVEGNPNPYAKAAFYGDKEVFKILNELYKRWEEAGCKGTPLDYATIEELRVLAMKAQQYRNASVTDMLSAAYDNTEYILLEEAVGKGRGFKENNSDKA